MTSKIKMLYVLEYIRLEVDDNSFEDDSINDREQDNVKISNTTRKAGKGNIKRLAEQVEKVWQNIEKSYK